jgi:hypothetical protein
MYKSLDLSKYKVHFITCIEARQTNMQGVNLTKTVKPQGLSSSHVSRRPCDSHSNVTPAAIATNAATTTTTISTGGHQEAGSRQAQYTSCRGSHKIEKRIREIREPIGTQSSADKHSGGVLVAFLPLYPTSRVFCSVHINLLTHNMFLVYLGQRSVASRYAKTIQQGPLVINHDVI